MMNTTEFVQKFAEQFEETEPSLFEITTAFRSLEEWSSLTALSVIAMVDEEYNIRITGDDIRKSVTIEDLYTIVKSRQ